MPIVHEDLIGAALLLCGGAIAGFANVLAGGGSLLTMPLLIFLGLPETTANGSARLAIIVQNFIAIGRYHSAGMLDFKELRWMASPAIIGATIGASIGSTLAHGDFRRVLGWITLAGAGVVVLDVKRLLAPSEDRRHSVGLWLAIMGIGLYGGAVQAGVGYLILATLTLLGGMGLVEANVLKILLVQVYAPIALGIFIWHGQVDWWMAIVLSLGQAFGAWLGAGVALKRGASAIRAALAIIVALSGLHLLGILKQ